MWNRLARNAVTTLAVAAAVLCATPARADRDGDHDEWREGWRRPAPVAPAPAPVVVVPVPYRPSSPAWAPAPPRMASPWRYAHGRMERSRIELRHEYRELDEARGRFYATWDGRPWTRERFERWYAGRHAALDARAAELERWSG